MRKLNFLTFFALSILFSCTATAKPLEEYNKILVLGDSLSAGYNIPLESGWVNLLRQELKTKNSSIKVINASVSGDTTGQGLSRLKPLLEKHKPDLLILELGGNDGLRGIAPALIKRNLAKMIDMALAIESDVLLLGMHILPNYGKRYTEAFHQNYLDLAKEKETMLIPFFLENVADKPELMQNDGIHPNEKAQKVLLNNLKNIR